MTKFVFSKQFNLSLQSQHVNEYEGTATGVSFDLIPQASIQDMVAGGSNVANLAAYDETALCSVAFRYKIARCRLSINTCLN